MMTSKNYTVRELCDMIDRGELCLNQSTQRKFVYASIPTVLRSGGKTTKAGAVVSAILDDGIQLPALFFWKNADTGHLNVHDGKQRLLSVYYFIHPNLDVAVTMRRGGADCGWSSLSEEEQTRLLDYEFCVMTREGGSAEEEKSFNAINTNSLPLTPYECLAGMYHGAFLDGFERFVSAQAKVRDAVAPIGRGEQAYAFLLSIFDIADGKEATMYNALLNSIRAVRDQPFDPEAYAFDRILIVYCDLCRAMRGLKDRMALRVAGMIVRRGYDADEIVALYRRAGRGVNDVKSWDFATHQTFVGEFALSGVTLDPQRFFPKSVKDELYLRSPRCSHVDDDGKLCREANYGKLEVDHIVPWCKGGRTVLDNAQLLCKAHNAKKGGK